MNLQAPANNDELGPRDHERASQPISSGEINAFSILALEEEIRGHEMAISKLEPSRNPSSAFAPFLRQLWATGEGETESIQSLEEQIGEHRRSIVELKRTRNSLLNVSRLPPEILGDIFCWIAIPTQTLDLDPFERRSYNFLFVCRHWFEVTSCTPQLWGFWGDNLKDWTRRHLRYPTAPLDLVLNGILFAEGGTLDNTLRTALQDRAAQDTIRQIHLNAEEAELLASIISSLTANCEGIRSNSVESVVIHAGDWGLRVDISDFFTHYRFPKLQHLKLVNCTVSSWDLMMSRTSVLTILDLYFEDSPSSPTTTQLLSILGSNPTLQKLRLAGDTIPVDGGDGSHLRVPLHHLKILSVSGNLRNVVTLLHRLDHTKSTNLILHLGQCTVGDISPILGPYLRDYIPHRCRSHDRLGLCVSRSRSGKVISFHAGDGDGIHPSALESIETNSFVEIAVQFDEIPAEEILERTFLEFIAETPREKVIYFSACHHHVAMADVHAQFPNLRILHLDSIYLPGIFPEPSQNGEEGILPFLRHISFEWLDVTDDDEWSLLTTFLSHRASHGNQLDSLAVSCLPPPWVVEVIGSMVREFTIGGV